MDKFFEFAGNVAAAWLQSGPDPAWVFALVVGGLLIYRLPSILGVVLTHRRERAKITAEIRRDAALLEKKLAPRRRGPPSTEAPKAPKSKPGKGTVH